MALQPEVLLDVAVGWGSLPRGGPRQSSTKLGLLRDGWKENRHGRRVGTSEDLEAAFQRTEKGGRKIRVSPTHAHRLCTQLANATCSPRSLSPGFLSYLSLRSCPSLGLPRLLLPVRLHRDSHLQPPPPNSKEQGFAVKTEDFKDSEMQPHVRGWGGRDSL